MNKTIRLTGRIESDEQMLFTVNTKVEGWIERLYVDYTGRYLKKGEPLLEIYSPELLAAQQELISLNSWKKPEGTTGRGGHARCRLGATVRCGKTAAQALGHLGCPDRADRRRQASP